MNAGKDTFSVLKNKITANYQKHLITPKLGCKEVTDKNLQLDIKKN